MIDDDLAVRFLAPGQQLILRACQWQPVRTLLIRATESVTPGMCEQVGSAEYRPRYLQPVGREMPVSEMERFVLAEKPGRDGQGS